MKKIHWDQSFSVGVAKLDEQHKGIIDMINQLLADPKGDVHSETISDVLAKMTKYAIDHFQTEERLLEEHRFPETFAHKEMHIAYREKSVALCLDTMDQKDSVPEEIFEYLKDWWTDHILKSDMKYCSFFNERGVTQGKKEI